MAYTIVQRLLLGKVDYKYDRDGDVLYLSFGPPKPAVAIQVEDWLALRLSVHPPYLAGMTIVGFKKIFERVNRYIEQELPKRVQRVADVSMTVSYDDQTDTFMMRFTEKKRFMQRVKEFFNPPEATPTMFEPLVSNVYIEKSIPSKDIIGFKVLDFTKSGPKAMEAFLGAIVDTVFEPQKTEDENAHLVASSLIHRVNWEKFAAFPA